MTDDDAYRRATNILKAELARSGVGYGELSDRLNAIGIQTSRKAIASKINRGTFSFAFFMQCMEALNQKIVRLGE